jgi:hypothetical protein
VSQGHPYLMEQLSDARRRDLLAAAESARLAARVRAREHRSLRGRLATTVRGLSSRRGTVVFEPDCATGDC